jgi:hypothetical protein
MFLLTQETHGLYEIFSDYSAKATGESYSFARKP